MKFAISTKNEVLKFGEVRSSSSLKSSFATQVLLKDKLNLNDLVVGQTILEGLQPIDQVYDGLAAPYTETSAAAPVNVYGQSKLSFERALTAALPSRSVCLRSSLILGPPTPGRCRKGR